MADGLEVGVQRPESAVTNATGLVGALSLAFVIATAKAAHLSVVATVFLSLAGTALPMAIWAVAVERVHRNESTGLDFSIRRSAGEVWCLTRVKLVGLAATFALIVLSYYTLKIYRRSEYQFYLQVLYTALPAIILLSPVYIWFVSRHMRHPRDGLWHFGKLVSFDLDGVEIEKVKDHLRGWCIKAFFLAFMMSIYPDIVADVLRFEVAAALSQPIKLILFLIQALFLFDVCFGTIGYVLTLRPLDSHIYSANPHVSAWVAALICYPPFALMGNGGPLDYRAGTQEWLVWFAGRDGLLLAWGLVILSLTFIYAWSTVIFGIRFSNLTHRGIITDGPYRFFKHPAYLSKNIAWWLIHLPFLSTANSGEALRNCLLLLAVNAVYVVRARTEEKHLLEDPQYRAYSAWIAQNGILERVFLGLRKLWRRSEPSRAVGM